MNMMNKQPIMFAVIVGAAAMAVLYVYNKWKPGVIDNSNLMYVKVGVGAAVVAGGLAWFMKRTQKGGNYMDDSESSLLTEPFST